MISFENTTSTQTLGGRPKRSPTRRSLAATASGSMDPPESAPDASLTNAVGRELCACGYAELSGLHVTAKNGALVLRGQVSSYYLKQLAQTAAMRVAQKATLTIEVEVAYPDSHGRQR